MLDKDMREPLFDFLEGYFGKIRTFEEKIIAGSRADIIGVIDGAVAGFEIKSNSDTYTRLKTQTRDYDKFCDLCYAVIGTSHIKHVAEHIPDYWGIICIKDTGEAELIREAVQNPNVKINYQIQLMWRMELNKLLEINSLPKYAQKSKKFVQDKLIEKVDNEILINKMTELLFERDNTLFDWQPVKAVRYRKTKSGIKVRQKRTRYAGKVRRT